VDCTIQSNYRKECKKPDLFPCHYTKLRLERLVHEESRLTLGVRREAHRQVITAIVDGDVAEHTCAGADRVARSRAAVVLTVLMTVQTHAASVWVFLRGTLRPAVWTILDVFTPDAVSCRLTHKHHITLIHFQLSLQISSVT